MINNLLEKTGLLNLYKECEFIKKEIKLRDGRDAILWVNINDGHGILDETFWEKEDFYTEEYRKEFSATLNKYTNQKDHLRVYKDVNKRQFKQFKNYLNKNSKFLEVGSSFGGILQHINKLNLDIADSIEPNKEDAEFSRKKYKNCNIMNMLFENYECNKNKYNIIVSFEVLEHVTNLSKFLQKLHSILEYDGIVNFEVPNHNDALLVNYRVPRYQEFYYHKAHVHYFTAESLKKIFKHFNFSGEVNSFQMYSFFNQVYWIYNNSPQSSASEALSYPKITNNTITNKEINKFFTKTNKKYQKLINKNLSGDCLVFTGKKQ